MPVCVQHRRVTIDGIDIFYREAGPADAPVVLLPHGYPCSSYEFRNYMRELGDHWRLLAPDFPGSGYSATPESFAYDFDGFATFLNDFTGALGVHRFALYLHDFGSWIGLRLAMRDPGRITALIVQNGDIYEDVLGPKYAGLKEMWKLESGEGIARLREFVSFDHFRDEFVNDVRPELAARIPPDLWTLHWALMTEQRRNNAARIIYDLKDNIAWFPRYQAFLREHQPPTLILWGPQDGYMPEESARAYLRDLPKAELHLLDGGHWLLETNLDEAVSLSHDFLQRRTAAG
ncbi:alpha/beta fold hydrolase [Pseudorhodoplanes sinuspersici]|uniref:Hydrolase n=1 Tax=Pseudorhodoplanes sinuspersici TaxID=1235591 RepID=A0A1W6ZV03_9HYPH|nr:alpha/beta hydrolase [Pseudorhodoplanes sinuspersici]ARQ01214.1 hydrolase [Pseudorhodoplanes sinuspersici]RKE72879.1 pimeloyl-ACP methyl ester carboxylesterase [Pseudorhodoplanes sinuspersici]